MKAGRGRMPLQHRHGIVWEEFLMSRRVRHLLGYRFTRVDSFDFEHTSDGTPRKYMPQRAFSKANTTPLNPHGTGPFCRLTVKGLPADPGVYALTLDRAVAYVGRAQNLAERWGSRGYAAISPRNCYVGGQSTNCKINSLILSVVEKNAQIELWFHETSDVQRCEDELISGLSPVWNGRTPDG